MKLSWFNTNMVHIKYIQQMNICNINARYKRDRVWRQWIKHKKQDMFRDSSHCSTFPPSHRRIFTICPHRTFHKEPPPRNYNSTLGVQDSSIKHDHLYTRGIGTKPNHNHLYTRGTKAQSQNTITSTQERQGDKAKTLTQSPLQERDNTQSQNSNTITSTQEGQTQS